MELEVLELEVMPMLISYLSCLSSGRTTAGSDMARVDGRGGGAGVVGLMFEEKMSGHEYNIYTIYGTIT
jgi:uncharacterized protein YbjQ (UPF0145 family)